MRHGQPQLTVQSPTCLQPSSSSCQESQEKDREIQRLTQQLEVTNKELQDTKQQQIDLTRALQEDLQTKERKLIQLRRELQEKQQTQATLQHEQRLLQQQLQESQERERVLHQECDDLHREHDEYRQQHDNIEQDLRRQLQESTTALQQTRQAKERQLNQLHRELQEKQQTQATLRHEQRLLQQQLQDQEEREQQQLQDSQERERVLHDDHRREHEDLRRQLQESTSALQQTRQANVTLQQQVQQLKEQSHWVVRREEIKMTEEVLGKGGWGEVKVAKFRGLRVAAKCLHEVILSPYNISVFTREMKIAARVRHPNLLQFIGATRVGTPIILSELMPTSLRKELETGPLPYHGVLAISQDIACGLNYLHLFKPDPILHRDVSTANVLLQPISGGWRAKVSDYGSANLQPMIGRTVNPGNPVYSAPEAGVPRDHSPAMDVYSYGVVLIEMMICRIPEVAQRQFHINSIRRQAFKALIERCLKENRRERPTMSEIIRDFNETI